MLPRAVILVSPKISNKKPEIRNQKSEILIKSPRHFIEPIDDFSCPPSEAGKAHVGLKRKS
jgi:hypothetical protein